MKKFLFLCLCLTFAIGASPSAFVAGSAAVSAAKDPQLAGRPTILQDPEPPITTPALQARPPKAGVEAILEPIWTAPVPQLTHSVAWGDYDLDGDLDLAVANYGNNRLYTNAGGTFTETWTFVCDANYPDNSYSIAWSDYDLDGYLDLAVGNFGGKNCVFHNEAGSGTFTQTWLAQVFQNTTSVAWAGWDVGTEFSIFMAVGNADEPNAVYRYEAGDFDLWWTDLQDATTYSVAWGDYDRDGDPDLAVGNFGQANLIYRNDGTDLVVQYTMPESSYSASVNWGDMNGDGWLDLAVGNNGTTGLSDPNQVYCNSGLPAFDFSLCWTSDDTAPTTEVAWGDYDGDGDLDLAAASEPDGVTRAYVNEGGMLDTLPAWDADDEAADSEALRWGDWDGDGDLELAVGYYAAPSVVYDNTQGSFVSADVSSHISDTRSVAWGDWDGDGDLDLAVANSSGTPNQVLRNEGGSLVLAWTSPEAENTRAVAWGDWDGDGDLDLAAGNGQQLGGQPGRIYCNEGGWLVSCQTFGNDNTYSLAWGDFDGDQDLDLAVGNYEQANHIYINAGGSFEGDMTLEPEGDQTLALAWGDYDQDYDLDLAVANSGGPSRVYTNQGDGTLINQPLPDEADMRSVAWADWDGDGDLDLALGGAGADGFVQIVTAQQISGTWTFAEAWRSDETYFDVRSVAWGDYDGDGDFDLAVGLHGQFEKRNVIYRNDGATMVRAWVAPAVEADPTRSVAWADYDADGDLDLAVGNYLAPANPNRLYINTWGNVDNLANDPMGVVIDKPGLTDNAWFFASHEILDEATVPIEYTLYDDEGDRAFRIEPQVSWNGGGRWESAWEVGGDGTENLSAGPGGTQHVFVWDALNQLLVHQGQAIPVPPGETREEMDVAFRIVAWSNPDHGGLIQRPASGSGTTLFRLDLRPDWYDSVKTVEPEIAHPGETVEFTLAITQTDHGQPPGSVITDPLPAELSLVGTPAWNMGDLEWTSRWLTWTGALDFEDQLLIRFDAEITLPLTNGLTITNCAYLFDGLHAQFTRCAGVVISSTSELDESFKRVNGLPFNTAMPGDPLTYTVVLTNTGTENAVSVVMTDAVPLHVNWSEYLTATGGLATYADGVVTWQGDVNVYQPVTITYQVTVAYPLVGHTLITNTAWTWSEDQPSLTTSPPVTTTVLAPDLRPSTKMATAGPVLLGEVIAYTISLGNSGQMPASPVEVLDRLPANSSYVPGSFWSSAGTGAYEPAGPAITWTGDIDIGGQVTVTFRVTAGCPVDPGWPVVTNTAEVRDPVGGLVTLEATTTLALPDLTTSEKTASTSHVAPGESFGYRVAVRNTGGAAPGVWMFDELPAGIDWTGVYTVSRGSAGYVPGTRRVEWNIGPLAEGEQVNMMFRVVATYGYPSRATVNEAQVWNGCEWKTLPGVTVIVDPYYIYLPVVYKRH